MQVSCPECGEQVKLIREISINLDPESGERDGSVLLETYAECTQCYWQENIFYEADELPSDWDYKFDIEKILNGEKEFIYVEKEQ